MDIIDRPASCVQKTYVAKQLAVSSDADTDAWLRDRPHLFQVQYCCHKSLRWPVFFKMLIPTYTVLTAWQCVGAMQVMYGSTVRAVAQKPSYTGFYGQHALQQEIISVVAGMGTPPIFVAISDVHKRMQGITNDHAQVGHSTS